MSLHTARLATEKAVFRPALPLCHLPGIPEMHMAKLSYAEQLKHPNWQRKRLEVLELYDFQCCGCASKEKTLHVHHKQYLKGRLAWEYELENFEALCEDCHKDTHEVKERLERVIAQFPSSMYCLLADILVGFGDEHVSLAEWEYVDNETAQVGRLAWHLHGNVKSGECFEAADCFIQIGPDRFMAALRSEVHEDFLE
jgi:hypothetical protein